MAKLRLTKNSLQQQQQQLKLYSRVLPSLDLKRRQLTVEAQRARAELRRAEREAAALEAQIGGELPMLANEQIELAGLVAVRRWELGEQNVVGVRLPVLERVEFTVAEYSYLTTPAWIDILVRRLQEAAEARLRERLAAERVRLLDHAVRRITQRVNLFDKVLIPTAQQNIQRIRIFLGDAERAAVITSKLVKAKQQSASGRRAGGASP